VAEKFDPRFDPAFQPGFDPRRDAAPSVPRTEAAKGAEPVAEPPAVTGPATPTDDAEGPAVEPNPFERTLWIVAAALVIGGIAVTFWSNSTNYYASGSEWTWQQVLQQSSWALSTPMITVGLGTGVALLFRRAAQWRPEE
jgi:hypothetical protein